MTQSELAYWNWKTAERRAKKCAEVGDRTGQSIAESQANRLFAEWLASTMDANERPQPTSPTADGARTN